MSRALSSLLSSFSKLTLSRLCVNKTLCSFLFSVSKFSNSWFLVNMALCSSWVVFNKSSLSLVMCNSWCHISSIVLLKYSISLHSLSHSTLKVWMWCSSKILERLNSPKISIYWSSHFPIDPRRLEECKVLFRLSCKIRGGEGRGGIVAPSLLVLSVCEDVTSPLWYTGIMFSSWVTWDLHTGHEHGRRLELSQV